MTLAAVGDSATVTLRAWIPTEYEVSIGNR